MMTKTRRIVGTRMRQLRKTAGFSQDRLGRASDLSGKFIGEVERGEKSISISLDSLTRISDALKVPLHDLARIDQRLPDHANQIQLEQLTALARRHPKKLAKLVAVVRELVA
jgi:transcriptional regulator with XRE-family HTH domain